MIKHKASDEAREKHKKPPSYCLNLERLSRYETILIVKDTIWNKRIHPIV